MERRAAERLFAVLNFLIHDLLLQVLGARETEKPFKEFAERAKLMIKPMC